MKTRKITVEFKLSSKLEIPVVIEFMDNTLYLYDLYYNCERKVYECSYFHEDDM